MMKKQARIITAAAVALAAAAAAAALAWNPLSAYWRKVTKQPDKNGMYQIGAQWFEEMPDLNEKSVVNFAGKLNKITGELLTGENRVFYSVIPDKSWYVREEGYKTVDQDRLMEILRDNLSGELTEIDLASVLNVDSYYASDRHWRQELLEPVVAKLAEAMNFNAVKLDSFTANQQDSFMGSYFKFLPKKWDGEPFYYLTNDFTENAQVENTQHPDVTTIYDLPLLESENTYDAYLSGVSPFITIKNPDVKNGRELVVFRDSFTSSLAPLLLSEYETITLVDLRFMFSTAVPDYLTFTDQDVLFLYSTWIVNNSAMLR